MVQQLIVIGLFLAAVAYLGYQVYRSFQARSGCSSGCGSCGVDFSRLQKDLEKKNIK